jgi:two-component system OmpR family response regulator
MAELLARLRVLMRRGSAEQRETVLRACDLEMDLLERHVTRGGQEIALTHREFEVLEYLLRHKGQVVTREMLGRDVWKEPEHALTNVVEVYITLLRRKIEVPERPAILRTIRGVGYCLGETPCDSASAGD